MVWQNQVVVVVELAQIEDNQFLMIRPDSLHLLQLHLPLLQFRSLRQLLVHVQDDDRVRSDEQRHIVEA